MKRLIIIPFLAIYLQADDNRMAMVSEYKTMFSKIGKKRVGIDPRKIDAVKTPFVKVDKKQVQTKEGNSLDVKSGFVLQAMFNKKVKISGAWYKLGDEVDNMKIISIRNDTVWLKNSEFKKRLTMRNENAKISIK